MEKNFVRISPSTDPHVNMATDQWLLSHVGKGELILHLYQNENAVIIGKNQNPYVECDRAAMERDGVKLARRISGGGAVYHDMGNLNFSFIASPDRFDKDALLDLILRALQSLGIPCERSGRNDLLADGRKFSGTALCDQKGNKLFHGTLLHSSDLERLSRYLTVDPKKIRSKGIASVRARVCNLTEFCPDLTLRGLQKALLSSFESLGYYGEYALNAREEEELEQLACHHRDPAWFLGACPTFDLEWRERVSFGCLQLCFTVSQGVIQKADVFTDAMDPTLAPAIESLLTGIPFTEKALGDAFLSSPRAEIRSLAEYSIL